MQHNWESGSSLGAEPRGNHAPHHKHQAVFKAVNQSFQCKFTALHQRANQNLKTTSHVEHQSYCRGCILNDHISIKCIVKLHEVLQHSIL